MRLAKLAAAFAATFIAVSPLAAAPLAKERARQTAVAPKARAVEVILLRGGIGGIFSQGLDAIGVELKAQGVPARVAGYGSWRSIERQLIAARERGRTSRIVLIGHSFGADAATAMAAELAQARIPVDLMVTLAATAPRPVAPNVRRALNFYFASGGWGLPLTAASGFRGKLDNRDYSRVAGVGHFNIEKQSAVQDEVVQAVLGVTRGGRKR